MRGMANKLRAYTTIAPGEVGESLYEDRKSQFFGFAVLRILDHASDPR